MANVEDKNKRHSCCGLMKAILKSNNKDVTENTTNTQVHLEVEGHTTTNDKHKSGVSHINQNNADDKNRLK